MGASTACSPLQAAMCWNCMSIELVCARSRISVSRSALSTSVSRQAQPIRPKSSTTRYVSWSTPGGTIDGEVRISIAHAGRCRECTLRAPNACTGSKPSQADCATWGGTVPIRRTAPRPRRMTSPKPLPLCLEEFSQPGGIGTELLPCRPELAHAILAIFARRSLALKRPET